MYSIDLEAFNGPKSPRYQTRNYSFDLVALLKALAATAAVSGEVLAGSNRRNIFPDGLNHLLAHIPFPSFFD
jgi:hypothetical protein